MKLNKVDLYSFVSYNIMNLPNNTLSLKQKNKTSRNEWKLFKLKLV